MSFPPRIAIIGAGPVGLEAALYARLRGYEVTVYERGILADHVRQWGHVTMFSPFGMNSSEWGRQAITDGGGELPHSDAILTGHEFFRQYLEPLSRLSLVAAHIRERSAIGMIGRRDSLKGERIGDPDRGAEPFRLTLPAFQEQLEADVVLDCSGTFGQHNYLGAGGLPCPGESNGPRPGLDGDDVITSHERVLATRHSIEYRLPHILAPGSSGYEDVTTLVIGGGYSAATNVVALSRLHSVRSQTRVIWLTRRAGERPVHRIPADALPERDHLAAQANQLALAQNSIVEWQPRSVVRRLEPPRGAGQRWGVWIQSLVDDRIRRQDVDRIIANVGFRPDHRMYEELHVHQCYATQGPMKLAAKLLGETSADCLAQTSHGAEVLRNPEPNFYILGMKSYGRRSNFLIQVGLQQIVGVFSLIKQDWDL